MIDLVSRMHGAGEAFHIGFCSLHQERQSICEYGLAKMEPQIKNDIQHFKNKNPQS